MIQSDNRLSHNLQPNPDPMCPISARQVASSGKLAFAFLATWSTSLKQKWKRYQFVSSGTGALLLVHGPLLRLTQSLESRCFCFPTHSFLPSGSEKGSARFGRQVRPIPFFGGGIGLRRCRAKSHLQTVWTCLTTLPGFVFSSLADNWENPLFAVAWDHLHLLKALGLKWIVCYGRRSASFSANTLVIVYNFKKHICRDVLSKLVLLCFPTIKFHLQMPEHFISGFYGGLDVGVISENPFHQS